MNGHLVIKRVQWHQRQEDLRRLRHAVFVEEQGVSPAEEWDGRDAGAAHFLALYDNRPVACARLQPTGKIERMAVAAPLRGMGVGKSLLRGIIAFARKNGLPNIHLDAQTHALGFYTSAGFIAVGDEFKDAGILHRRMVLGTEQSDTDTPQLAGPHDARQAMQGILRNARHSVDILSDRLAPALFNDAAITTAVANTARRSPRSRVRMLVKDTRPLQANQHDLVQLARRLPSRVSMRAYSTELEQPKESFVIVDREALVYFTSEADYVGFSRQSARAEAQRLLEGFDRMWDYESFADPNLRQLHI